jgi:PleD family two-component response regulator
MFATVRDLAITHAGRPDGIVTLSAGVADLTEALVKGSLDDVVARADAALYRAKRGGRDQVVLDVEAPADR